MARLRLYTYVRLADMSRADIDLQCRPLRINKALFMSQIGNFQDILTDVKSAAIYWP